jgi:peptidoglycan-associated lipoprotein
MANARREYGWILAALILVPLVAVGTVGCHKKAKGPIETTGTGITGEGGGGTERAGQVQEAQSRLQTVYFDYDRFDVRADQQETLRENAKVIQAYPQVNIQIQGHCDERGSEEYNLALGDKRARAAKDFLVNLGISPDRLSTISFGEERPVDPGHDEAAWAKNRRDEFVAQ